MRVGAQRHVEQLARARATSAAMRGPGEPAAGSGILRELPITRSALRRAAARFRRPPGSPSFLPCLPAASRLARYRDDNLAEGRTQAVQKGD